MKITAKATNIIWDVQEDNERGQIMTQFEMHLPCSYEFETVNISNLEQAKDDIHDMLYDEFGHKAKFFDLILHF